MKDQKGVALLVVLITITLLALLAAFGMHLSYNYAKTHYGEAQIAQKVKAYYRAQAGVVDAQWRIRANSVNEIGGENNSNSTSFKNPDWDPSPYSINLATNAVSAPAVTNDDVRIDIGPVEGSGTNIGLRRIQATGSDK